ncbi:MAG: hypothetical protein ACOYNL_09245 [Rickettsiales bacterium]
MKSRKKRLQGTCFREFGVSVPLFSGLDDGKRLSPDGLKVIGC